jgi:hypothetical protein
VFSSGPTSLFQAIVKIATLSNCDHVAIGLGDQLLHARDRGVVLEPRAAWARKNNVIAEAEILPDVTPGLERCLSRVGQNYDLAGILRIGIGLALRRTLSPLRPWGSEPDEHTCAGFAMLLDPHGEVIPEWQELSRRSVVPCDLLNALGPSFRKLQPLQAM